MDCPGTLLIRNDLDELSRLAEWVSTWAAHNGVPEQLAQILDLCSTETVTNVMDYAFDDGQTHQIAVHLQCQGDDVVLEVEDDGIAFDPIAAAPVPQATIESTRVGGWGIRIVRKFSEQVSYRRVDGHNHLTMVFRPPPLAAA